jgi:hypothetical protein
MRERRSAHVRPMPPSSDRLDRAKPVRSPSAPPPDILRRYRPVGSRRNKVPLPIALAIGAGCLMFAIVVVSVGAGLVVDLANQVGGAFGNAIGKMTSQAPATVPPSGVALDTPVLDAARGGYTDQTSIVIAGQVPAASVGKTGYTVNVYSIGKNDARTQVARVEVGGTTRFATSAISLAEGPNTFVAALAGPTGEGQSSPPVTYILDTKPPKLSVTSPSQSARLVTSSVDVAGTTDPGATVAIRNQMVTGGALNNVVAGSDGKFRLNVPLVAGPNEIDLTATDQAGNTTNSSITLHRDYGQLAAHLSASPAKFSSNTNVTLKLTLHATAFNGAPLGSAKATFAVTIAGLGPIVSPELTTDATGTATWQVSISGAIPGNGQASVLVTSSQGDQVTGNIAVVTT